MWTREANFTSTRASLSRTRSHLLLRHSPVRCRSFDFLRRRITSIVIPNGTAAAKNPITMPIPIGKAFSLKWNSTLEWSTVFAPSEFSKLFSNSECEVVGFELNENGFFVVAVTEIKRKEKGIEI